MNTSAPQPSTAPRLSPLAVANTRRHEHHGHGASGHQVHARRHRHGHAVVNARQLGVGAATRTVQLRAFDLLEDGRNAGFVLLDLVQRFVDGGHKIGIARLHLAHIGQALAQRGQDRKSVV